MFKNLFPDGTADTVKQPIMDSYDKYKNYKLPLKDASGTSLDYNIICPNIKIIGDDQGEKFTSCNSTIYTKYKTLRDEFIVEKYRRCNSLSGPNKNECQKNDKSHLYLQTTSGPDYEMKNMAYFE